VEWWVRGVLDFQLNFLGDHVTAKSRRNFERSIKARSDASRADIVPVHDNTRLGWNPVSASPRGQRADMSVLCCVRSGNSRMLPKIELGSWYGVWRVSIWVPEFNIETENHRPTNELPSTSPILPR
jgi:hypothetical protein